MNTRVSITKSLAAFAVIVTLLLAAVLPGIVSASPTFGQTHSYDVRLRGNGSAVVNARLTLTNNEDKSTKTYKYSVVSGSLSDVMAIQEIDCLNLPYYSPMMGTDDSVTDPTTSTVNPTILERETVATTEFPECYPEDNKKSTNVGSSRAQIDYYTPYYSVAYKKVPVKQSDNSFTLTLPQELEPNESATVVLIYDLTEVAEKKLGVYTYDFKTLKTNERISDVNVAVSVDNDYVLEGSADDKLNYNPEKSSADMSASVEQGASVSSTDQAATSSYIDSIGDNGTVTKHATTLAAGETMSVSGRYATNEFLLHWPRTVLRVALGVLLVVALIVWYKRRRKQLQQKSSKTSMLATAPDTYAATEPASDTDDAPDSDTDESTETPPEEASEPKQPSEATVTKKTSFVTIDVRALPFYGPIGRFVRRLQARGLDYPLFGWMCAFLAFVFLGILVWAFTAMTEQNYYGYYQSDLTEFVTIGIAFGLYIGGFLGFLLITVGLPFLYAPNFKTGLRIITNVVLFSFFIALLLFAFLKFFLNNSNDDYCNTSPYSYSCSGGVKLDDDAMIN